MTLKKVLSFFLLFVSLQLMGYETFVEADAVNFNGELLNLSGNVTIKNFMGRLVADSATLKKDQLKSSGIDFPWIQFNKNVSLFLIEGGILKCDWLHVDHIKQKIWLAGNPPVTYSDQMGEVYADRAQIDYEEGEGGKFCITQVHLLDHVKLVNRGTAAKPACQYALADELLYFPKEQLMLLKGNQERVLFYDTLHAIELSAPTVQAQRHPETGKESIRGIGDVRCLFGIEEFEKIDLLRH